MKKTQFGVALCFYSVFTIVVSTVATRSTAYMFMPKPFQLYNRYLGQIKCISLWKCTGWHSVTLTQGHGCNTDSQISACQHDKVRQFHPITQKFGIYIHLFMLITRMIFSKNSVGNLSFSEPFFIFDVFFRVKLTWNENGVWILGQFCDPDFRPHP